MTKTLTVLGKLIDFNQRVIKALEVDKEISDFDRAKAIKITQGGIERYKSLLPEERASMEKIGDECSIITNYTTDMDLEWKFKSGKEYFDKTFTQTP